MLWQTENSCMTLGNGQDQGCGGIHIAVALPALLAIFKFVRAGSVLDLYLHLNKSPSQAVHCNSTPMRMLRSLNILLTSVSLSFHYLNQYWALQTIFLLVAGFQNCGIQPNVSHLIQKQFEGSAWGEKCDLKGRKPVTVM